MICLIAGNWQEAKKWAYGQGLEDWEWFYPYEPSDLLNKKDFHVLVVGTAGQNVPPSYFERIYQLALERGRAR